ncbi:MULTISPECIES: hypothetical protein [Sorangium]|uniref:hypothetical protein n=1 Tax=Sorangium TaxID=39643 RepID=UPI003D9C52E0
MSALRGERPTKRSLILAGGGMKVAFQAGVLEVWLDEAGLSFDHVDGLTDPLTLYGKFVDSRIAGTPLPPIANLGRLLT